VSAAVEVAGQRHDPVPPHHPSRNRRAKNAKKKKKKLKPPPPTFFAPRRPPSARNDTLPPLPPAARLSRGVHAKGAARTARFCPSRGDGSLLLGRPVAIVIDHPAAGQIASPRKFVAGKALHRVAAHRLVGVAGNFRAPWLPFCGRARPAFSPPLRGPKPTQPAWPNNQYAERPPNGNCPSTGGRE